MSVQFGRWNFTGESPAPEYIKKVSASIAPYGPDSSESCSRPGICILYRGFHTTKESRREKQPYICPSGAVLAWDGRLDNREDLISELRPFVTQQDSDVAIVAAAFEKWRTDCFAKLIGDWALSIWDSRLQSLILAKDPIGPRHLYYSFDDKRVTWCTVLDPLVLFADRKFKLSEEYIAGWLSLYPATHLTPYVGITSVQPSSCVFLGPRKHIVAKYWDFDPAKKIRYRSDGEYEEHFRAVFFKAIQRRLRSDTPILAELSGGRDSSSIVCVADEIMARGEAEAPRLDTISYYDDSEPNWNERPYFTLVEKKRGRMGWHIDVNSQHLTRSGSELEQFARYRLVPTPGHNIGASAQLQACLTSEGNRGILSGIGGDEVMGGVPTPIPELQDLVARLQITGLVHQLKTWALQQKKPWIQLLLEAGLGFCPQNISSVPKVVRPSPWLQRNFTKRYKRALTGYARRIELFGPLPSFQDNMATLNTLRRQLASKPLPLHALHEKCYPYLDRSLLEFICAIPRQQSVRPRQRRSLIRRAVADLVPSEILNRKTKALVARAPLIRMATDWATLIEVNEHMISAAVGVIEIDAFRFAIERARRGEELSSLKLRRAIHIEGWLRHICNLGVVKFDPDTGTQWALQLQLT